mmetsp:Transcript_2551/g.6487  ORF Transcript_2551/g.6487 Transcript_2551/m.6487 type:complete len:217 (-) Transcript_2551:828-1478(-)
MPVLCHCRSCVASTASICPKWNCFVAGIACMCSSCGDLVPPRAACIDPAGAVVEKAAVDTITAATASSPLTRQAPAHLAECCGQPHAARLELQRSQAEQGIGQHMRGYLLCFFIGSLQAAAPCAAGTLHTTHAAMHPEGDLGSSAPFHITPVRAAGTPAAAFASCRAAVASGPPKSSWKACSSSGPTPRQCLQAHQGSWPSSAWTPGSQSAGASSG